jgi:hypothetical protein
MPTSRIAVACCRRTGDADPTDLYPDSDAGPLTYALRSLGVEVSLVSWDDPAADWERFSHVLVSSTWDSVDRPSEYLAWARQVASLSFLLNPVEILEWNINKVYLQALGGSGVPVVPTTWVEPHDSWSVPSRGDFVVKPSVSAGGRNTARYAAGDRKATHHVDALLQQGQTVMIQDYLGRIDSEGEVDVVFIDGLFSHAVIKRPVLRCGEGVVDRPWERMAWAGATVPTDCQRQVCQQVMEAIVERVGVVPLYARVDLVSGHQGEPLAMEVELIDPYLSLDTEPAAAHRLAEALLRPRR